MTNKLGATTPRDVLENLNDINDTLSKGKIEFNPTNVDQIPDNTLVVLDYNGSAGVIIPDNTPRLDLKNTFTQPQVGVDATSDNEFATLGQVKKLGILENDVKLTVGAGGDFEDLLDAIYEALKYKKNRYSISITIKTGHIVRKPIVFYSTDLSYININSEVPAEEILVSRESAIGKARGFYAFMIFRQGAVSPMINCIFKYDDSTLPSGVTSSNHSMALNFEGSTLRIGEYGGFLSNIGNGVSNFYTSNLILLRAPRIETSDSTKFAVVTSVASITQGSANTGSTAQPYNITRNTITDDGSMHLY